MCSISLNLFIESKFIDKKPYEYTLQIHKIGKFL